jgi:cytochrome b subunit of formate dehydrogenase
MDFLFRYATSVYGQDQLLGASWDLIWWFLGAALAIIVADAVFRFAFVRKTKPADDGARVRRHAGIDRLYHWLMALSVLTLIVTAFAPILDWKFEWVTPHWIAGVALTALVLVHIVRALFFQSPMDMMITPTDVKATLHVTLKTFGKLEGAPQKPGKYSLMQKAYHLGIAALILVMIGTGLVMFAKIDTSFWQRNPYMLEVDTWGLVYAAHGLCAMTIFAIVAIHVYLGLRPDKWKVNRSMFTGDMAKADYLADHDPARWAPEEIKRAG